MAKPCKLCGGTNHSTAFCFSNKRNPIRRRAKDKKTGLRYRPVGKKSLKWLKIRAQWFKDHPPNHQGYYICHWCGDWLLPKVTTLDHVLPRSKRPDLVFDVANLVPCCYRCNQEKGSQIYPELFE